ncbi:hypothetical protein [Paenibacillus roseus]|uniref:hypothetical protein n=1 Tax=Paenibacillus roseus TaxID=2798579 RepID=UPI0018EAD085|nr:hypothetical protein [Paenibacillus roseus]
MTCLIAFPDFPEGLVADFVVAESFADLTGPVAPLEGVTLTFDVVFVVLTAGFTAFEGVVPVAAKALPAPVISRAEETMATNAFFEFNIFNISFVFWN